MPTHPQNSTDARIIILAVLLVLCGAFGYAAWIELGYSADGAYVFARVIENETAYLPYWSRAHADFLLQLPLVLATRAGVDGLGSLSTWFHFGLVLPFLLSFALCWFARRPAGNDGLLLFPLISYILICLPASSLLSGQSQVLAVMVWPTLFLLLRSHWSSWDAVLLLGLLLVLCRAYEAYLASALVFLVLLLRRFRLAPTAERVVLIGALLLVVAGLGVAAHGTLFPSDPQHRQDFLSGLVQDVPRHPLLLASVGAVLALGAAVLAPQRPVLSVLPLILALGSIGLSATGRIASAGISFNTRSLTGTLLPLLLIAALIVPSRSVRLARTSWVLAGVTLIALIGGYVSSWSAWRDFRKDFVTTLDTHQGYVPVQQTLVAQNSQRWRWTTSLLSVLWSPQCVRTILLSSSPGWYPFDPRASLPLQERVPYHESFRAASPSAAHCR